MLMETSDLVELLAKNLTDSSSVKLVKTFLAYRESGIWSM